MAQIIDNIGLLPQPRLINLIILHHPLHVIARFGEGDAFDPVDHLVDRLAARVAISGDPFRHAFRSGIIGDEGEDVGSTEAVDLFTEIMRAERGVVARIAGQHCLRVGQAVAAGHALGGSGQQLQQAAGIGGGDGGGIESAFLPGNRIGERLAGAGNIGAGGNDAERIGERCRIDAAAEGRLADLQRNLVIAVAFRPCRQNGKLAGTVELFRKRPIKAVGTPAVTGRLQPVDGAYGFAAGETFAVAAAGARIGDV
ncbi:hypothetical protein D3C71_946390 [compost metagenome]